MAVNQAHWNELVPIHVKSAFYDVDGFKAGRSTLDELERDGVGEVAGRSLLHLQCHFGMDTLSWARLGAQSTGVDFSGPAIELARELNEELGLDTRFIQANIYDLPSILDERFDIVVTSYGVLFWLPDITAWAGVVSRCLKPGGRFCIVEGHPFIWTLDQEGPSPLDIRYDYFHRAEPNSWEEDGSYADPAATVVHKKTYEWNHPISDVVGALIAAGLRIESLDEYEVGAWQAVPLMVQGEDGWWRLPPEYPRLPFTYRIVATKP
jgi:ubiquinone/menaquinone biosynthesis C-methylase UbiE